MAGSSSKRRKHPPEPLERREVEAILRQCSTRAPTGIRNKALIAVLYRAGLRISEALALKPKDVSRERGTLRVLHGKGDKARTVLMDDAGFDVLARWIDRRKSLGLTGHRPIFCTLQGAPLKTAYVRALLPRLARKAKIDRRVHPHALRHTHASELAWEGKSIPTIQAQLGHSSPITTARYLHDIAPTVLAAEIRSREWSPEAA